MKNRVIRDIILVTLLGITYISSGQNFNSTLEPNLQQWWYFLCQVCKWKESADNPFTDTHLL